MNILVVDDKEDARYLLETLLTSHGHQVTTAMDGQDALEQLRADEFDLVVSDILMPRMDGFQLCKTVRADDALRKIWFVFYTATYTHDRDAELAMQLGADDFITKPAEPAAFMERISKVVESPAAHQAHESNAQAEEAEVLRLYSERLVAKLEERTGDLEEELKRRMEAENDLRRYAKRLEILREIDCAILEAQSPKAVAEIILDGLRNMVHATQASVTTVDLDTGDATVLAVRTSTDDHVALLGDVFPADVLGGVDYLATGETYEVDDLREVSPRTPQQEMLLGAGIVSLFVVPLRVKGRLIGTLNVGFEEANAITESKLQSASELANQLAIALCQTQMRQELDQHAQDLERTVRDLGKANEEIEASYQRLSRALSQTVEALATASEVRDPYTAGHQRRVTDLAMAIAKRLGLTPSQMEGLRVAGLMHDIGKLAIPSELLSKPSRLTETEFGLIQTHPNAGQSILQGIEFPWPVTDIVVQHHERLDGSGYPQGLAGDAILKEAKILAVADVVEAMASHRPYRPARGIDQALAEIREHAGIRYDEDAVTACVELIESGEFSFSDEI
jgi:putative nucleotidyltransferase with HDIG domain